MDIVLTLHSFVRWVIVVVALVALAKFALDWRRRAAPDNMDRGLMSGFSGLVDLQALLGIILIVWVSVTSGGFLSFLPHMLFMLAAVATAHLPVRWRKREDATVLRNNLLTIVGVLALVLIGVSLLPQGWFGHG